MYDGKVIVVTKVVCPICSKQFEISTAFKKNHPYKICQRNKTRYICSSLCWGTYEQIKLKESFDERVKSFI